MSGAMNGDALVLGFGERSMSQIGKGLLTPPSISLPSVQRGKHAQTNMRRDPFVPLSRSHMQRPSGTKKPTSQKGESDVPKVVGIAFGQEGFRAVLQRENGQRTLVKTGSVMEPEHARVIRITDDAVVLEYQLDANGRIRFLERRLSIYHSDTTVGPS